VITSALQAAGGSNCCASAVPHLAVQNNVPVSSEVANEVVDFSHG